MSQADPAPIEEPLGDEFARLLVVSRGKTSASYCDSNPSCTFAQEVGSIDRSADVGGADNEDRRKVGHGCQVDRTRRASG